MTNGDPLKRYAPEEKIRYGTVNGDPLKRYAPEEKIRYGSVRVTNSDALLYITISQQSKQKKLSLSDLERLTLDRFDIS